MKAQRLVQSAQSFCFITLLYCIVLYCTLYCIISYHIPLDCFLRKDKKGVDPEGRGGRDELEEIEDGETINRIYWVKKIYFQ